MIMPQFQFPIATATPIRAFDLSAALAMIDQTPVPAPVAIAADLTPRAGAHLVYNFEVEETHTYIAGGVRVHNTSIFDLLSPAEMLSLGLGGLDAVKDLDPSIPGMDYITLNMPDGSGKTAYKIVTVGGKQVLEVYHTYLDEDGNLVQSYMQRDENNQVIPGSMRITHLTGAKMGEEAGSLITPFLTAALLGENSNAFERIAANTILGTFLENLFEATGGFIHDQIASAGRQNDIFTNIVDMTFGDIVVDLGANAVGYTRGELVNWIMLEVFGEFASDSYAGEVFTTLARYGVDHLVGAGMYHIATNVLNIENEALLRDLGLSPFSRDFFFGEETVINGQHTAGLFSVSSIGSLALKIGFQRLLPQIETIEGQIASGLTSLALTTLTDFFAKFTVAITSAGLQFGSAFSSIIGAFNPVVMIISTLVGKLFDFLFEKHPEAYTNVIFNEDTGRFELGSSWSDDGGNKDIGQTMAKSFVEFMNGLLDQTQANEHNGAEAAETLRLVFGHYEEHIRNGAARNFDTMEDALKSRIIDMVQELEFADGDLKTIAAMEDIIEDANLLNDIHKFGAYSYWKKIFGIKISKKTVYTEINGEAADGMENGELAEVVEDWGIAADAGIIADIVAKANSIYGDIKMANINDVAKLQAMVERIVGGSWSTGMLIGTTTTNTRDGESYSYFYPNKQAALDLLGDVLYLRALAVKLMDDGYSFATKAEMLAALRESGLRLKTDAELHGTLVYNMQIAAEYQAYLENKSAYDRAIAAAGPDSAYAQGWALTFFEADRLGLTKGFAPPTGGLDNRYIASVGNDTISSGAGNDTIRGYDGDDHLRGGDHNDLIYAGTGNDTVYGDAGNDTLHSGAGNDVMYGGAGDDTFRIAVAAGNRIVYEPAEGGTDTLILGEAIDYADLVATKPNASYLRLSWNGGYVTYQGVENLRLEQGSQTFAVQVAAGAASTLGGTGGQDLLIAGSLNDTLSGGGGDDILIGGAGNDSLYGGVDNDTLMGGVMADRLNGGDGTDTADYSGSAGGVQVDLRGAGDALFAGNLFNDAAGDILIGIENLRGSRHDDVLYGDAGANRIEGNDGDDHLLGLAEADTLAGEDGADTLDGGEGGDRLIGGAGADSLIGGASRDTASYETATAAVLADLQVASNNTGDAAGDRYSLVENLIGSAHRDNLRGDAGGNVLMGGLENDTIYGRDGNDSIYGQQDNDNLLGGMGGDHLDGGAGIDMATYSGSAAGVTVDLRGPSFEGWWGVSGGEAAGDTLIGIENLTGSNHVDRLVGDDLNNSLSGLAGADGLHGWLGNDTLYGGDGDDTLHGNGGDDILLGGAGADSLNGHSGIDRVQYTDATAGLVVDLQSPGASTGIAAGDTFTDIENLHGSNHNDTLYGDGDANTIWGGTGDDRVFGRDGNDVLSGLAGNDRLIGGAGADSLYGGDGGGDVADYATAAAAVTVSLTTGTGTGSDAAGDVLSGIEFLTGSAFADALTGNEWSNRLDGGLGNDTLESGAGGADSLYGGDGNDSLFSRAATGAGASGAGVSTGTTTGTGLAGADTLFGGAGVDTMQAYDFGTHMVGGAGADYHYQRIAYQADLRRNAFASYDTAGAGLRASLTSPGTNTGDAAGDYYYGIYNLVGSDHADTLEGSAYNNVLIGGAGADSLLGQYGDDILIGGIGADRLDGGAGWDTADYSDSTLAVRVDLRGPAYADWWGNHDAAAGDVLVSIERLIGGNLNDVFVGDDQNNRLTGGAGNDSLHGWGGQDHLFGGAGSDFLSGNSGVDTMEGGGGNDTLVVDSGSDQIIELAGQGVDLIRAFVSYTMSDNVEKLVMMGTDALSATGNAMNNDIQGNDGANTIDGGLGDDTLTGGAGGDVFRDAKGSDHYDGGAGYDRVEYLAATRGIKLDMVNTRLSTHIAYDDVFVGIEEISGSNYNDTLYGNDQGNTLYGRGANDLFYAREGNDRVYGESGDDILFGGSGADTIDGGTGADRADYHHSTAGIQIDLRGAAHALFWGNVGGDAQGDVLSGIEHVYGSQHNDTIVGDTGANLLDGENGNDALHGFDGHDTLRGRAGNDTLQGNTGSDQMEGGAGNDSYYVDSTGDVVVELAGEGADRVYAAITYTLGSHVENLTLLGTGNLNGTGNALANSISGNTGNNTLTGGAGDDSLYGGDGNDYLIDSDGDNYMDGGAGDDMTLFSYVTGTQVAGISTFVGGAGMDTAYFWYETGGIFHGGAGFDIAYIGPIYSLLYTGYLLDLADSSQNTDFAANIVLTGVEAVAGGMLDDTIRGDAADNSIDGGYGNDMLLGREGNDTLMGNADDDILFGDVGADRLDGGAGIDRAQYSMSTVGLVADLQDASVNTGWAAGDTYVGIENLYGSAGNDTLRGDGGANTIWGGTGNDLLAGRLGNDVLSGGAGNDRFVFYNGDRSDAVSDFTDNADTLDFRGFGLTSAAQAMTYARQSGVDVIFTFNASSILTVRNTTLAVLSDDIIFS
jgi:Ca2+-binding RTX toxin-like protein